MDYIPLGAETALPGRNSWRQLRAARGHATAAAAAGDDDDDDDDDSRYPENLERIVNERASGFHAKLQIACCMKPGTRYREPKVMNIHSSFFKSWKIKQQTFFSLGHGVYHAAGCDAAEPWCLQWVHLVELCHRLCDVSADVRGVISLTPHLWGNGNQFYSVLRS